MDQIVADRLKSRDTVFLGHSVKKVATKALSAVTVSLGPVRAAGGIFSQRNPQAPHPWCFPS